MLQKTEKKSGENKQIAEEKEHSKNREHGHK